LESIVDAAKRHAKANWSNDESALSTTVDPDDDCACVLHDVDDSDASEVASGDEVDWAMSIE
jgi:hypothetical protein